MFSGDSSFPAQHGIGCCIKRQSWATAVCAVNSLARWVRTVFKAKGLAGLAQQDSLVQLFSKYRGYTKTPLDLVLPQARQVVLETTAETLYPMTTMKKCFLRKTLRRTSYFPAAWGIIQAK